MTSQLMQVKGITDGAALTGNLPLTCQLFYSTTGTKFWIPKGMKLKIWGIRNQGAPVSVLIDYTYDVSAGAPTYVEIDRFQLINDGQNALEKRRPIVIDSLAGKEGVIFKWDQAVLGVSRVTLDVEITDDE